MHTHRVFEPLEPRIDQKAHAARAPFPELGEHVLGYKRDLGVPPDELVLVRVPLGGHEGQICRAVRWCDRHEVAAGKFLRTGVEDQLKAQLLHVEVHAAIQIANENGDGLQA